MLWRIWYKHRFFRYWISILSRGIRTSYNGNMYRTMGSIGYMSLGYRVMGKRDLGNRVGTCF